MSDYTNSNGVARVTIDMDNPSASKTASDQAHNQERDLGRFQPSASIVGDVHRVTVGGPQETDGGFRSYTHDAAPESTGDVLATARTSTGGPVTREIRGDDTVDIGGMRTSVRAAVAAGFLHVDGEGRYTQPGYSARPGAPNEQQPQPQTNEQDQQPAEVTKLPDLPTAANQIAASINNGVDNLTVEAGINSVIERGEISADNITAVATQLGLEKGEAEQYVATLRSAMEDQARTMVGQGAQDIFSWAYSNRPDLMREAARAHVNESAPDAYADVVRAYWLDLPKSNPDALLNAPNAEELGVRKEKNGGITIAIKGMRMPFAAAVHAGYIVGPPRARR